MSRNNPEKPTSMLSPSLVYYPLAGRSVSISAPCRTNPGKKGEVFAESTGMIDNLFDVPQNLIQG